MGGKHIDAGGGDSELVAIFDGKDESEVEKGVEKVIRGQDFKAEQVGDVEDVDGFVLATHGHKDEGAVGSIDQRADEVVGAVEVGFLH